MSARNGGLLLFAVAVIALAGWWLLGGRDSSGGPSSSPAPASTKVRPPGPATVAAPASPEENPPPLSDTGLSVEAPPRQIVLLARDAITKDPLPGARVWQCGFSAHGPEGQREAGDTPTGHHPACISVDPCARTGADGRVTLDFPPGRFFHVVADGRGWGPVTRGEDGGLVADLPPGGAVRLQVRRWAELEEPVIVAYPGVVAADLVPERPVLVEARPVIEPGAEPSPGIPLEEAGGLPMEKVIETEMVIEEFGGMEVGGRAAGEEILVEGFEPGPWTVFVERGQRGGEVYARGTVVVVAGETVALRLDAVPTTAGPRAPVKATVSVSAGWRDGASGWVEEFEVEVASPAFIADPDPFVVLHGLDVRNVHLQGRGSWNAAVKAEDDRWTVALSPDLPPGRYRATVNPPGWSTVVEVPAATHEITLTVPDPAEMEVHLKDGLTGRPIPGRVLWSPFPGGDRQWAEADPATGVILLRAPPGEYTVEVSSPGHRDLVRSLTLAAGFRGRVEYALDPAASVRVLLRVDGAPFDGNAYVYADMKFTEEEMKRRFEDPEAQRSGLVTGQSGGVRDGTVLFENLTPGPCEVRVLPVRGFAPVTPRTVHVHAGRVEEVVIDLVRE